MAQAISESKLREWMQKLGPRLISLSANICRDRHQAEEIVQEAFIKLWQSPPDAGEIAYSSWMRRVVTNLSINALQRTKRPATLPVVSSDRALMSRERAAGPAEDLDEVRQAMDRLDPAKRAILMLRAGEKLSYDEIATHLGVPVGTVMSRLNRARTALMELLKSEHDVDEDEEPRVFEFRRYKQG